MDLIYCVIDIETNTVGETPNPDVDELRYVGFRHNGKHYCYHYTEIDKIQKIVDYFQYFVGHNIKQYDIPILKRYGIHFNRNKIFIDTYQIADNRMKSMLYIDLNQGDRSLDRLAEIIGLEVRKTHFDYKLLKKDRLDDEEYTLMEDYLFNDLIVSDELFKYFYNLFYGFKEFMSEENQVRMAWLINRPGSTAYKCICHLANLPEEYSDVDESEDNLYSGGFVSQPYIDFVEG